MDIIELNKAISQCNPYNQKELRRYLVGQRREMLKHERNQADIKSGNIPAMLQVQS